MTTLLLFICLLFSSPPTEGHSLTITVDNIKTIEGTIEIGIFNKGDRFLEKEQAYKGISVEVTASSETVVVKNLPAGTYAISLYHDKNGNGAFDRNFLGLPKEPYGFSNNFKPKFSPPKFTDCCFNLTPNHSVTISLIN